MERTTRTALALALVLALALTAGCAKIAEKAAQTAVEKATGVKVDEKGESITFTGKDGEKVSFSGDNEKLPEGIPSDFPVYDGKPEGGGAVETEEGKMWTFNIITTDKVSKVLDWYKDELAAKDWKIENSSTMTIDGVDGATITAKKGDREAIVNIGGDPDKGDKVTIGCIVNEKTKSQ